MPGNNVHALWQRQAQGVQTGIAFIKARNRFKDGCEPGKQGGYRFPNTLHGSLIRPKKGDHTVRVFVGGKEYGQLKIAQRHHLDSINKIYLNDNYYRENIENLQDKLIRFGDQFMEFDMDNSGDIDFYELKMMMEKLGQPKTHLELKKMIAQVDKSGTGTLSYREFVDMMLGPRSAIFKYIMQFEDISRDNRQTFKRGPPPKRSLRDLP